MKFYDFGLLMLLGVVGGVYMLMNPPRIPLPAYQPPAVSRPPPREVGGPAKIADGDTLQIGDQTIRLYGVDAPERTQECYKPEAWPCGEEAKAALAGHIGEQAVRCLTYARDRWDRLVAVCYVGIEDLSRWLIQEGWAVAYHRAAPDLIELQIQAKANKKGIWQGEFMKPWEWRRKNWGWQPDSDLEKTPTE